MIVEVKALAADGGAMSQRPSGGQCDEASSGESRQGRGRAWIQGDHARQAIMIRKKKKND